MVVLRAGKVSTITGAVRGSGVGVLQTVHAALGYRLSRHVLVEYMVECMKELVVQLVPRGIRVNSATRRWLTPT